MAACLITVSGTSGEVLIRYTLSGNENEIRSGIGNVYIDDTASSISYTTLSGDAIATSGCVTITELNSVCYKFSWETFRITDRLYSDTLYFDQLSLGGENLSINPTNLSESFSWKKLGSSISQLGDNRISVIAGLQTPSGRSTSIQNIIIRVIDSDAPVLRIKNKYTTNLELILAGVESVDCIPTGYDTFEECVVVVLPTTTSTSTTSTSSTTTTSSSTTTTTTAP